MKINTPDGLPAIAALVIALLSAIPAAQAESFALLRSFDGTNGSGLTSFILSGGTGDGVQRIERVVVRGYVDPKLKTSYQFLISLLRRVDPGSALLPNGVG